VYVPLAGAPDRAEEVRFGAMDDASTPRADGFAMPAEFDEHQATWMSWPTHRSLWNGLLDAARDEWAATARAVSAFEPVLMVCNAGEAADVLRRCGDGVEPLELPINDSWLRDNGPIFVRKDRGELALVHFGFNSWGEKYLPYDDDARLPELLASHFGVRRYRAPFVLEGGSFFVDGEGTLLTTEQCLLHPNRNPSMSRGEIEEGLRFFLGVEAVIWLPHGLVEDRDTDGHIDGLAQYVRPGVVMLAVAAGSDDPNAPRFAEDRTTLAAARDAKGRGFEVLDGPVNSWADVEGVGPVVIPYMNHYLANGAVIVPIGGGPEDERALDLLAKAYPDREIVGVPGAMISHGGGGPHCITQQVPAGMFVS
jgi:agmatine deiminase